MCKIYLFTPLLIVIFVASLLHSAQEKVPARLVGFAASPLTNPDDPRRSLTIVQRYKPDYMELKTICESYNPPRPLPHIAYVDGDMQLAYKDEPMSVHTVDAPSALPRISLVNSVGLSSADPQEVEQIIHDTMVLFKQNHEPCKLIFSIYGSTLQGFVSLAQRAVTLQVPYVAINLSCPNVDDPLGMLYRDPHTVFATASAVNKVLAGHDTAKPIPLIVKVGAFKEDESLLMAQVIRAVADSKAYALYGINSIPVRALTVENKPTFGTGREVCGATGAQIQNAARNFTRMARKIIEKHQHSLRLFVCGGALESQDFEMFFKEGADVVFSATGPLCNPAFVFPGKITGAAKL